MTDGLLQMVWVNGVCSSELRGVRKVLSGSNSTAVPHFKFSASLFPAQAAPADFAQTREKRTDSTQVLWSLTDSCQVRVLSVASDEAFPPPGHAIYDTENPRVPGQCIHCFLVICSVEILMLFGHSSELLVLSQDLVVAVGAIEKKMKFSSMVLNIYLNCTAVLELLCCIQFVLPQIPIWYEWLCSLYGILKLLF